MIAKVARRDAERRQKHTINLEPSSFEKVKRRRECHVDDNSNVKITIASHSHTYTFVSMAVATGTCS